MQKPWVQALNIDPNEYEQWTTQTGAEQSVTYWALEKGKLRAQDYLLWAREFYKVPVLKDSYFKDNANVELWQQIQSVANWSPEMLPLEQWEGVVFVGCVEPPQDVKWSFPVQYVIASARSLKNHWQNLHSGKAQHREVTKPPSVSPLASHSPSVSHSPSPPIPSTGEAPPPLTAVMDAKPPEPPVSMPEINIPPPPGASRPTTPSSDMKIESQRNTATGLENNTSPSPQRTTEIKTANVALAPESAPLETPEGIQTEMPSGMQTQTPNGIQMETPEGIQIDLPPPADKTSSSPEVPQGMEMPEGFELNLDTPSQQNEDDFQAPEGISLEIPPPPKSAPASASTPVSASSEIQQVGNQATANIFADISDTDDDSEISDISATTTTRFSVTLTGVNKSAPKDAVINLDSDTPASIEDAKTEKEVVAWAFNELKQHFTNSMMLLFEGDQLKPWKWEIAWDPKSTEALEAFEVEKPGMFRIVRRTKLPYHGYLVDSDANNRFFEIWGYSKPPSHVTVVPVKFDNHMIGVVLSVGEESAAHQSALISAERTVAKLTEQLQRGNSKAA